MSSLNNRRILYVEDNVEACSMLSLMLSFSGIDVQPAGTIAEALRFAETEAFDLFLLDSTFQDGTGLDLCRQLGESTPQTPVVFYSGEANDSDRSSAMAAGAVAYLTKPNCDLIANCVFQNTAASRSINIGPELPKDSLILPLRSNRAFA
ncbi:MAG: response regulator [Acidobacteriota bacterium]